MEEVTLRMVSAIIQKPFSKLGETGQLITSLVRCWIPIKRCKPHSPQVLIFQSSSLIIHQEKPRILIVICGQDCIWYGSKTGCACYTLFQLKSKTRRQKGKGINTICSSVNVWEERKRSCLLSLKEIYAGKVQSNKSRESAVITSLYIIFLIKLYTVWTSLLVFGAHSSRIRVRLLQFLTK